MTLFAQAPATGLHNLFFGILPPSEVGGRILSEAEPHVVRGKLVQPERVHITLLSLVVQGRIPPGLVQQAADMAAAVRACPFRVMFRYVATGPKSTVLTPDEPLDRLRMLREQLGFTLRRGGLDIRLQGRFAPHVTAAYGGQAQPERMIDPIVWTVDDFVLIDSHVGETRHEIVGRWPLRG
jgi:2'-5' RNA ligase